MTAERNALLAVAGRLDKDALKKYQIAGRKELRELATALRNELKDELYLKLQEITAQLKKDIKERDAIAVQVFQGRREHQADAGVLATAIAQHDAGRLILV